MTDRRMKLVGVICAVLFAAISFASVLFYRQSREAIVTRDEAEKSVVELKRNIQRLQHKTTTATAAVQEAEETLTVDQDEVVRGLEERLKAKDEQIAMLHSMLATSHVAAVQTSPEERRSWMDDLKVNDPERYKEIRDRQESARQAAKYEIAKKAAHFLQRDDSSMSETEAEQHAQMMNLLSESLNLTEKLKADLPREQRWEVARTLRENMRELSPMLESERDKEFYQIGKDMGYSDHDAAAFASYIREVVDLTSVQSIFRNSMQAMGGGWGGRGGGGDGPGNRPD